MWIRMRHAAHCSPKFQHKSYKKEFPRNKETVRHVFANQMNSEHRVLIPHPPLPLGTVLSSEGSGRNHLNK
jgi:hypothetical protein